MPDLYLRLSFLWKFVIMKCTPNDCGAPKSPNSVTSTFFNTVHLLLKDLRFEHGGTKLASCHGCNLTSLHLCYDHYKSVAINTVEVVDINENQIAYGSGDKKMLPYTLLLLGIR